jgi:hypothetical protein
MAERISPDSIGAYFGDFMFSELEACSVGNADSVDCRKATDAATDEVLEILASMDSSANENTGDDGKLLTVDLTVTKLLREGFNASSGEINLDVATLFMLVIAHDGTWQQHFV